MADQGYDISDYYDIDPRFGTMEDMDELLKEAKSVICISLWIWLSTTVPTNTNGLKKACEDPDGEYGKYFYIADAKDYKLPNNWRSYFGIAVWIFCRDTPTNIICMSSTKQPDLNWENPKLREEIYKMINWSLDRGVAGFRIDAIMNIKKPNIYTSYPADRDDGLAGIDNMLHDAEGIDDFLHEMKTETFEKHHAFTVGEVFTDRPDALEAFIGNNGHFSSMFDFAETIAGKSDDGWYKCKPVVWGEEYKKLPSVLRNAWGISDSSPISSKIMMNLAVSATISRKQTSVTPARKCLPLSTLCSAGCLSSIRDRNLV